MWLQWLLQQLESWELISEALGLQRSKPRHGTAAIDVNREAKIVYRDGSGRGRLDLLIEQGSDTLCILEIKTKLFSDADLEKQRAYSGSPDVSLGAERVFVAVDTEGFDPEGVVSIAAS